MRKTVLAALLVLLLQPAFAAVLPTGHLGTLRYNAAIDTPNTGPDQNAAAG